MQTAAGVSACQDARGRWDVVGYFMYTGVCVGWYGWVEGVFLISIR
jgi:hypothetical protein